jgi:hypothetical protein
MKTNIYLFFIFAVTLFSCSQHHPRVTVTNTSEFDLTEKPLIIQRSQIEEVTGKLRDDDVVLLTTDGGILFLPSQQDDMSGDGKWDEFFTLVNISAGERKTFSIVVKRPEHAPTFNIRTKIHFADKNNPSKIFTTADRLKNWDTRTTQQYFQFEGPGWENDVVGFRNYFDARNGIDIWGKTTSEMVLAGVGLAGGPNYHEMQPWGMDILRVGNSLGAGAIALETPDGLYRIGPDGKGTYHLVGEGPLRSTFDLRFEAVPLKNRLIDINHRICIIAGKPWYKSVVTTKGAEGLKLIAGIVNLDSEQLYSDSGNGYAYMFTHDNQGYVGEKLGLAIIVPQQSIQVHTAPNEGAGITHTYYASMDISDKPNVYFFMAGWEHQDNRWADLNSFEEGVNEQGRLIAAKLELSFAK